MTTATLCYSTKAQVELLIAQIQAAGAAPPPTDADGNILTGSELDEFNKKMKRDASGRFAKKAESGAGGAGGTAEGMQQKALEVSQAIQELTQTIIQGGEITSSMISNLLKDEGFRQRLGLSAEAGMAKVVSQLGKKAGLNPDFTAKFDAIQRSAEERVAKEYGDDQNAIAQAIRTAKLPEPPANASFQEKMEFNVARYAALEKALEHPDKYNRKAELVGKAAKAAIPIGIALAVATGFEIAVPLMLGSQVSLSAAFASAAVNTAVTTAIDKGLDVAKVENPAIRLGAEIAGGVAAGAAVNMGTSTIKNWLRKGGEITEKGGARLALDQAKQIKDSAIADAQEVNTALTQQVDNAALPPTTEPKPATISKQTKSKTPSNFKDIAKQKQSRPKPAGFGAKFEPMIKDIGNTVDEVAKAVTDLPATADPGGKKIAQNAIKGIKKEFDGITALLSRDMVRDDAKAGLEQVNRQLAKEGQSGNIAERVARTEPYRRQLADNANKIKQSKIINSVSRMQAIAKEANNKLASMPDAVFGTVKKGMSNLNGKINDVAEYMRGSIDGISDGLAKQATALKSDYKDGVKVAKDAISDIKNEVGGTIAELRREGLRTKLKKANDALNQARTSNVTPEEAAKLRKEAEIAFKKWNTAYTNSAKSASGRAIRNAPEAINTARSQVVKAGKDLIDQAKSGKTALGNAFNATKDKAFNEASSVMDGITRKVGKLQAFGTTQLDNLDRLVKQGVENAESQYAKMLVGRNVLEQGLREDATKLSQSLAKVANNLKSTSEYQSAVKAVKGVTEGIDSAIASVRDSMDNVLKSIDEKTAGSRGDAQYNLNRAKDEASGIASELKRGKLQSNVKKAQAALSKAKESNASPQEISKLKQEADTAFDQWNKAYTASDKSAIVRSLKDTHEAITDQVGNISKAIASLPEQAKNSPMGKMADSAMKGIEKEMDAIKALLKSGDARADLNAKAPELTRKARNQAMQKLIDSENSIQESKIAGGFLKVLKMSEDASNELSKATDTAFAPIKKAFDDLTAKIKPKVEPLKQVAPTNFKDLAAKQPKRAVPKGFGEDIAKSVETKLTPQVQAVDNAIASLPEQLKNSPLGRAASSAMKGIQKEMDALKALGERNKLMPRMNALNEEMPGISKQADELGDKAYNAFKKETDASYAEGRKFNDQAIAKNEKAWQNAVRTETDHMDKGAQQLSKIFQKEAAANQGQIAKHLLKAQKYSDEMISKLSKEADKAFAPVKDAFSGLSKELRAIKSEFDLNSAKANLEKLSKQSANLRKRGNSLEKLQETAIQKKMPKSAQALAKKQQETGNQWRETGLKLNDARQTITNKQTEIAANPSKALEMKRNLGKMLNKAASNKQMAQAATEMEATAQQIAKSAPDSAEAKKISGMLSGLSQRMKDAHASVTGEMGKLQAQLMSKTGLDDASKAAKIAQQAAKQKAAIDAIEKNRVATMKKIKDFMETNRLPGWAQGTLKAALEKLDNTSAESVAQAMNTINQVLATLGEVTTVGAVVSYGVNSYQKQQATVAP